MESESVRRIEPIATIDLGIRSVARKRTKLINSYPLQPSPFDESHCYQRAIDVKRSSSNDCKTTDRGSEAERYPQATNYEAANVWLTRPKNAANSELERWVEFLGQGSGLVTTSAIFPLPKMAIR